MTRRNNAGYLALGFYELIAALGGFAATKAGKEKIEEADLAETEEEAITLLLETGAMIELAKKRPDFDIPPVGDIPSYLVKAKKSQILSGREIVAFAPLLKAAQKIRVIFSTEGVDEENPLFASFPSIHGLSELIEESLDSEGIVSENATPQIEALTKSVNSIRSTIRAKAESLLSDPAIAPTLQEEYVTLRENRFVLPIRAEHKTHVEGILHDSSNSGQTFFIEPKALVDLNNRLKSAEMELAAEIEKLLAQLSFLIAEEEESILGIYRELTRLDVIFARARFSLDLEGSAPKFAESLDLKNAANPLMLLEKKPVVKNDISMPGKKRALIISGPNAGGKTVALKTVGLLCLIPRIGLYIPASDDSSLPFYQNVFADIGDSQSIHDDLSTFSAHVTAINDILAHAKEGSLVLLDELMVSTDPKEGSALGAAALERLTENGADVVVTTHFHELKILAQQEPLFLNAAMEFNQEEGRPTYRMVAGAPGSSSALEVAARLGMDPAIVVKARTRLSGGDERIEQALEGLAKEKMALSKERHESSRLLERAKADATEARAKKEEAAKELEEIKRTVKQKLRGDLYLAREKISALVENAKSGGRDRGKLSAVAKELDELEDQTRKALAPQEVIARENLSEGDEVYIIPLEQTGRLEGAPLEGEVTVLCGKMSVTVKIEDVIGTAQKSQTPKKKGDTHAATFSGQELSETEIDLRGLRAEEAVESVEKFLDSMINSGADSLRIIHGKGTGALKSAIRSFLANSHYKISYHPGGEGEGGDGVTVVVL